MTNEIEPVILGKAKTTGSFIYNELLKGDFARQVYTEVRGRASKDYAGAKAFNGHFSFNAKTEEINGSSTFWSLLTDITLRKNGLWIPTLAEGKALDAQGRLPNGVYMDFGVVLYTDGNPNSKFSNSLSAEAGMRKLNIPLVLPFSALNLEKADSEYGVQLVLTDNLQGVLSGEEARQAINGLDYKANSGLHGLGRDDNGVWFGYDWDDVLADFYSNGRVVRICGEATQKNLTERLSKSVDSQYTTKIDALQKQIDTLSNSRVIAQTEIDSYFK